MNIRFYKETPKGAEPIDKATLFDMMSTVPRVGEVFVYRDGKRYKVAYVEHDISKDLVGVVGREI